MRQSNGYIILFTAIMTLIVGGLLSMAAQFLGPAQKKSVELDTKSQILASVMDREVLGKMKPQEILNLYDQRIASLVVNLEGSIVEKDSKGNPIVAEEVSILKNYKKKPEQRELPVFKYVNESDPSKIEAYILPIYGAGLWDKIWGFVALDTDLQEIVGVSFDHKQETPGLGARIGSAEIQNRYVGKEIYDDQGSLISVTMLKGENNQDLSEHQVDGMSGATLTARGVNDMLKNYLIYYQNYFKKIDKGDVALR